MSLSDQLDATVSQLRERIGDRKPTVALILGSGLGSFADRLEDAIKISYDQITGFPVSGVVGHAGRLVVGQLEGVQCVAMQGRAHYYEGYSMAEVTFPARVMIRLGASTLIVTNAAGGIGDGMEPGTLMLIRDHLNLFGDNPLRGHNDLGVGPRFPDMTTAYDPELRAVARRAAAAVGTALVDGIYAGSSGPTYETPAEVQMLARLGADATGMSTVPEVIVANHMGARVLGISCITNKAAGLSDGPLSHDEVTETATRVRTTFEALLAHILRELGGTE